jgi:hypothetical protein
MSHVVTGIVLIALGLAVAPTSANAQDPLDELDAVFDDFYAWFGSMYDPETGGVFYSAAAQAQPDAFPPHIESTAKFVGMLNDSGQLDRLPAVMRDATVNYIRNKQLGPPAYPASHPLHGFFMHPADPRLDPDNPHAERRDYAAARAMSMSAKLLEHLGSEPRYAMPGSGDNRAGLPHLASGEAFTQWLADRRWERSWTAGGDLLTQANHIKRLPTDLQAEILDATWVFLATKQNPETGHWGNRDADGNYIGDNRRPYILLNGAHKIVGFFKHFDQPVPYADELMRVTLDEIATRRVGHICYVYNATILVRNLHEHYGLPLTSAQKEDFIRQCVVHLAAFRRDDGGFSTLHTGRKRANHFEPPTDGPVSNTDAAGLALKARDALHHLRNGYAPVIPSASDPRLFQAAEAMD